MDLNLEILHIDNITRRFILIVKCLLVVIRNFVSSFKLISNLDNFIEELSTHCEFKNDVEVRIGFDDVLHSNDGWVINGPQDLHLVHRNVTDSVLSQDILFANNFDRNRIRVIVDVDMKAESDGSASAATYTKYLKNKINLF
jgi:hypothetical protein